VHYATQDAKGYMWFATIDGLLRYDGNSFLTFRSQRSNSKSLPEDNIVQIVADKKQNLWVWSGNKIGIFNTSDFTFAHVPIQNDNAKNPDLIIFLGLADNGYAAIYLDKKGIYTYNPEKKMFTPKGLFQFPKGWSIFDIRSFSDDGNYFFSGGLGLAIFNSKTGHINYRGHNPDRNPYIQQLQNDTLITAVYAVAKNELWYESWPTVGYAPFINYLDAITGERRQYSVGREFNLGYFEGRGGLRQKNGRMWFCGRSYIVEYTGNTERPFDLINNEYLDEQSIRFDQAFSMYEDRQHNIWICTDNGIYLFNPDAETFSNYYVSRPHKDGGEAPTITAYELNDGRILVGTWGRGVYFYDSNFNPLSLPSSLKQLDTYYSIWSIHQHSKTGLVWIGMMNGELVVYNPTTNGMEIFPEKIFEGSTIRHMVEDKQGNLWFGLHSGKVVKWDYNASGQDIHKGYYVIKPKGGGFVQKLYVDKKGFVWMASVASGVYKYNPVTNDEVDHLDKKGIPGRQLTTNSANDILQYDDSLLLIATGPVDILNLNTNKITHFTTENGLPSNTVYSFALDDKGGFWMGMAHGLCRVRLDKLIFSNYDRRDGIRYDLFNPAGVYKLRDGRLVYTTDKNFLVFNPANFINTPIPAAPYITNFKLANKPLSVDSLTKLERISFAYKNTSIVIDFNSLNFTKQNKIHYTYKLEGLDKQWLPANEFNQAIYNYLPPGKYSFKVSAENSEGATSKESSLSIVVTPPFWQTWWFLGLLALLVIAIFYTIDKERISRLHALQKVRTQIARNLHEDVNTTLNNINLLSEMARIKADKDLERSKEYIDQINTKSRRMIDAMDDMLWSLNPENDDMEKTILRMKECAEGLQHTYGAIIQMEIDKKIKSIRLDMRTRHEVFLIFKEALRLITPHAHGSTSLVNADLSSGKLLLKIQNSEASLGEGVDAERSKKEMQQRAAVIHAELDMQTDKKGVSIILLVPLNR
jgi:ligand-binding sensor domain-containing protein/signal transduction histidine kinase